MTLWPVKFILIWVSVCDSVLTVLLVTTHSDDVYDILDGFVAMRGSNGDSCGPPDFLLLLDREEIDEEVRWCHMKSVFRKERGDSHFCFQLAPSGDVVTGFVFTQ